MSMNVNRRAILQEPKILRDYIGSFVPPVRFRINDMRV
jgi:hypothetical protein